MAGEWSETSLGDLVDIKHGFAFRGEFIHDDPKGDVLLTPGNFAIGGGFKGSNFKFYDGPVPEAFVLAAGDLVVTMTDLSKQSDTLGFPAFVPPRRDGRRYLHNQRLGKVVTREARVVDARYLHYLMCWHEYRHEVLASATGTTVKHTSPERIKRFRFLLPPPREQRAIARILGTLDDKIELNRLMAETLEAMARALFKSWFVAFDPVRAKAEGRETGLPENVARLFPDSFEEAELGSVPAGWELGSIGALADRVVDRAVVWQTVPLIDLGRMPQGRIALESWGLGSELKTSVTRFRKEDTLFGAIRPYFHKVGCAPIDGVTNTSVFVLRSRRKEDWPFTAMVCSQTDTIQYATRMARGTKMPVVSWPDLERYQVVLPPASTRDAFNRVAGQLLDRIMAAIRECRTLEETRRTLLPKLISGEVRVAVAESQLAERAS